MKKINNLSELLEDKLKKMYSSEKVQQEALPRIRQKANAGELRNTLNLYEKAKAENLKRLQQCFDTLDMAARGHKCAIIQPLIDDCQANISNTAEKHVADASLISTIQQINHYNIVNYGTAASYAKTLEQDRVASLLHDALDDEKSMDEQLSDLAEKTVNPSAILTA